MQFIYFILFNKDCQVHICSDDAKLCSEQFKYTHPLEVNFQLNSVHSRVTDETQMTNTTVDSVMKIFVSICQELYHNSSR